MQKVIVIGGGLAGLTVAKRLTEAGLEPQIYEARDRLGGRVLTSKSATTGQAIDLGPSWYWPQIQEEFDSLITELELNSFPQHDEGEVLHLTDPEEGTTNAGTDPVHGGAYRLEGGMAELIDALAATIAPQSITLNAVLQEIEDCTTHIRLSFNTSDGIKEVLSDRVVLAIPPRVLAENVRFVPELPESLHSVMTNTSTWMAAEAKAVICYPRAGWRDEGLSGSAFVAHERVVLNEIFDQSAADGTPGALGGFLALGPTHRAEFSTGLTMLVENQFQQIFGESAENGELVMQDWSQEPFTCSALDISGGPAERRPAHPLLRRAFWNGRLHLAGTETARAHPGHMAGAVESADRVAQRLLQDTMPAPYGDLGDWFLEHAEQTFDTYRQTLNRLLSQQRPREVTRLATQDSVAALLDDALDYVQHHLDSAEPATQSGAVSLDQAKPALHATLNRVIGQIIGFNRSSCALRNFPTEHELPESYIRLILQDASTLGRGFLNDMDALLAAHGGKA
ncbi:MAG: flavin monoamine oxidase family protein [Mangrovicoccus sp.]